jgi:hypothetical protein
MGDYFTIVSCPLVEYTNIDMTGFKLLKINNVECFEHWTMIYSKKNNFVDKQLGFLRENELKIAIKYKHLLNY